MKEKERERKRKKGKTYANDKIIVQTAFTIVIEKEGEQIGERRLIVENNHQIGINTQYHILLLLIHISHCLEECGNLFYQCISLRVIRCTLQTYNLKTIHLK